MARIAGILTHDHLSAYLHDPVLSKSDACGYARKCTDCFRKWLTGDLLSKSDLFNKAARFFSWDTFVSYEGFKKRAGSLLFHTGTSRATEWNFIKVKNRIHPFLKSTQNQKKYSFKYGCGGCSKRGRIVYSSR